MVFQSQNNLIFVFICSCVSPPLQWSHVTMQLHNTLAARWHLSELRFPEDTTHTHTHTHTGTSSSGSITVGSGAQNRWVAWPRGGVLHASFPLFWDPPAQSNTHTYIHTHIHTHTHAHREYMHTCTHYTGWQVFTMYMYILVNATHTHTHNDTHTHSCAAWKKIFLDPFQNFPNRSLK